MHAHWRARLRQVPPRSAWGLRKEESSMNTGWATLMEIAAVSLLIAPLAACQSSGGEEKISEFGRYQGYSEATYDGTSRTSDFLTLSDGTRLAYDLFLPTKK